MIIWMLNHYAVTPSMPGGTRHYDIGRELLKKNHQVSIFASSFHYSQHTELKLAKKEKWKIKKIDGINFVWIKTFPYQKNNWRRVINMLSYMYRVYWIGKKFTKIDKNIGRPDIIIGSSVHLLAVLAAYWLAKHYKAKFLMEVRDLWPQTLVDMRKFKEDDPITKILRFLEKFLYRKAKKIIVTLPLVENYITSLSINKNKIVWIPNGVDLLKFKKIERVQPNKYFKAMYLGAHGAVNALEVILDAAKIIQDKGYEKIRFILAGDGAEKKNLIKYKERLGLKNTEFRFPVTKTELSAALNKADLLIFNLKKIETFKYGISSNKLFDYMAAGKPIIFSVNAANNPVKEAGCGISVPPENPEMMTQAIIKLYQISPEERENIGRRGREYVGKYHSIPVLADKLEVVIREVCGKKDDANQKS